MMTDTNPIGRRIRAVRTWRGMTLTATAQLAGLSAAYLSRIERGERRVDKRSVMEAVANALRVAPSELTGQPYPPTSPAETIGHAAAQQLRAVLRDMELGALHHDGPPRSTRELRADVAAVNAACAASDYGVLGDTVPELLTEVAADRSDTEHQVLLAHLLHAAFYLAKDLGHGDLAWLVATRLHTVANSISEPAWIGLADFVRAHAAVGAGARERALGLVQHAADTLTPDSANTGQVYGMLRLSAALHSTVVGQDPTDHLADAERVAAMTGEGRFAGLMFGPRNVAVWNMAVALERGNNHQVPDLAHHIDPAALPSGRRSTYYCDLARGLATLRGRHNDAVTALAQAERTAPQRMRTNPYVRDTIGHLLSRARDGGSRELRGMAYRAGLAV